MLNLKSLRATPDEQLRRVQWDWMLGEDTAPYLTNEVLVIHEEEADAFAEAANTLYDMFVEAAQRVIDQNRFAEIGIPESLVPLIRHTWEDDGHLHLYGRFDFSGGLLAQPIKLLEFNADTPACVPETAVVQWAHLKANQLDESRQFNTLFEALTANFQRLRVQHTDRNPDMLFSAMPGFPEDETNLAVLAEAAREAGFRVTIRPVNEVDFSGEEGIFTEEADGYVNYPFWCKFVPWEVIAEDEPALLGQLTQMVLAGRAVVLNPAYTLLFQSKGLLRMLWELYPYHPLLLETRDQPLAHKAHVEKVIFGREGANVRIVGPRGQVLEQTAGEYAHQPKIYQEYAPLAQDRQQRSYQAGVFFAHEACGLGFRRGERILSNVAQFVGHLIE